MGCRSERIKQYQQAEQQLVDDVAWIPVYQQTVTYVEKPCVVGPTSNTFDIVAPDDWGSIYKSTVTSCADVSFYK
jgi:peptide/nickel transport system substrate-binding protein/oligopeptide transport system substrate-binding protein